MKIEFTKWRSSCNFFGIVWSFRYIWWVLLQLLKMITVKVNSKCFVKFSLIQNVNIFKCLTLLTKYLQVYVTTPCFLKISNIFFNTFKSVFTGALFARLCRCYNFFSDLSFWQNKHFVHSVLFITSLVSSISLWPSKEVEEASLISPFRKLSTSFIIFIIFLVLNIHFETICLLFSISIKQLFSYLFTFSYLDVLK